MNFCLTSLNTLKKLMKAMSATDATVSQDLQTLINEHSPEGTPLPASGTSMALTQLGLLERPEAGSNNLSV